MQTRFEKTRLLLRAETPQEERLLAALVMGFPKDEVPVLTRYLRLVPAGQEEPITLADYRRQRQQQVVLLTEVAFCFLSWQELEAYGHWVHGLLPDQEKGNDRASPSSPS